MNRCPFDNASISSSKAPRSSKKVGGNTKVAPKKKNSTEGKLEPFTKIGIGWLEIMLPIITVSEANGGARVEYIRNGRKCYKSEHWTDKHRRHKLQKGTVALFLRPHRESLSLPCDITLTRYASHKLDKFDNLPMSMKYILDAICEIITNDYVPGRADSHEGFKVIYDQVISPEYGVKVRIEWIY